MVTSTAEALSIRESEVLGALGQHLTNKQIASQLHISVRTVESHVSSLLRKLGAADRRELASRAAVLAASVPDPVREVAHLPRNWTRFVGRESVLDDIAASLAANRLVTLVGPGGIGKTRLATVSAQRVVADLPGGAVFVDLVPVDADCLLEAVAASLGLMERPKEPLVTTITEHLRCRRNLLVLDNCEHVLSAAGAFVESVLGASDDVVVLATSRERLGVSGERVVLVPPLTTSAGDGSRAGEAVALFLDRAGIDAVEREPADVADICRRLDGMPLAIELAAARFDSLGGQGLLAGLDDHLRLLARPGAQTGRHHSLRAVIDWSHELLDDEERTLFRRLGVFAGAADLHAAVDICDVGDAAVVSDLIGRLVDKSLLDVVRVGSASRWRMLETVHAYAREQLDLSGETALMRERHLTWAATTATTIEQRLADDDEWLRRFETVTDDLRAALKDAAPGPGPESAAYRLAAALGHLTYARRFLAESRLYFAEAIARAPTPAVAVEATFVAADAAFAEMRGDRSYELLLDGAARADDAGDAPLAALALARAAAVAARAPGTFAQIPSHESLVALIAKARQRAAADDDLVTVWIALAEAWNSAPILACPDPKQAAAALDVARRLGDLCLLSNALDAAGAAAATDRRHREAARLTEERVALLDRLPRHAPGNGGEIVDIFHMASVTNVAAGELETALSIGRREEADSHVQGLRHFAACHLLLPLALRGEFDEAHQLAEVMEQGWRDSGRPSAAWMGASFYAAAMVHGLRGDDAAFERWIALADALSPRRNEFGDFVNARVALHIGDVDRAMAASTTDTTSPWNWYDAYREGVVVETMVIVGAAGAEDRLVAAAPLAGENRFVAACLARARGRLEFDDRGLFEAVELFEEIGARFERACTFLLLPARAAEGAHELEQLRCPPPAMLWQRERNV